MHCWLLIGGAGRPTNLLYVQVANLAVLETGLELTLSKAFSRPSQDSGNTGITREQQTRILFWVGFFYM